MNLSSLSGTYTRTSFLLSLGRNLILKLFVVTSPGYFLSSKLSCSSSSPSDDVYEGAAYLGPGGTNYWLFKKQRKLWASLSKRHLYLFVVLLLEFAGFCEVEWLLPLWLAGRGVLRGRSGGWGGGLARLVALVLLGLLHTKIQSAVLVHFDVWLLPVQRHGQCKRTGDPTGSSQWPGGPSPYLGTGLPCLGTEALWFLPATSG